MKLTMRYRPKPCSACNRRVYGLRDGRCKACSRCRQCRTNLAARDGLCRACGRKPCRHCHTHRAAQGRRGLCKGCHEREDVRALYAPAKYSVCWGIGTRESKQLGAPTNHMRGTPGKLAVLAERAAAGLALWHPADAQEQPEPRG